MSDLICSQCGEENPRDTTFCIVCGKKFSTSHKSGVRMIDKQIFSKEVQKRHKFYRKLPMRMLTIVILIGYDYLGDTSIDWAYYPAAAIAIFAILIPIIKYRRRKRPEPDD